MLKVSATTPRAAGPEPFSCLRSGGVGGVEVTLRGELDIAAVRTLERALQPTIGTGLVTVDLRALDFIDAGGAQCLLLADRRLRRARGRLAVVRGPAQVQRMLELSDVARELELVDQPPRAIGVTAVPDSVPA